MHPELLNLGVSGWTNLLYINVDYISSRSIRSKRVPFRSLYRGLGTLLIRNRRPFSEKIVINAVTLISVNIYVLKFTHNKFWNTCKVGF